jgi:hypothetical protein
MKMVVPIYILSFIRPKVAKRLHVEIERIYKVLKKSKYCHSGHSPEFIYIKFCFAYRLEIYTEAGR